MSSLFAWSASPNPQSTKNCTGDMARKTRKTTSIDQLEWAYYDLATLRMIDPLGLNKELQQIVERRRQLEALKTDCDYNEATPEFYPPRLRSTSTWQTTQQIMDACGMEETFFPPQPTTPSPFQATTPPRLDPGERYKMEKVEEFKAKMREGDLKTFLTDISVGSKQLQTMYSATKEDIKVASTVGRIEPSIIKRGVEHAATTVIGDIDSTASVAINYFDRLSRTFTPHVDISSDPVTRNISISLNANGNISDDKALPFLRARRSTLLVSKSDVGVRRNGASVFQINGTSHTGVRAEYWEKKDGARGWIEEASLTDCEDEDHVNSDEREVEGWPSCLIQGLMFDFPNPPGITGRSMMPTCRVVPPIQAFKGPTLASRPYTVSSSTTAVASTSTKAGVIRHSNWTSIQVHTSSNSQSAHHQMNNDIDPFDLSTAGTGDESLV